MPELASWFRRSTRAPLVASAVLAVAIVVTLALFARDNNRPACCPGAGSPALGDSIDPEPTLRTDSLANGLRYYILRNVSKDNRTALRLVVNAGSVLEAEDQRGLAHAVEHMALRASSRFPDRAIDEYVRSLGMRRGYGMNGFTTMDDTEYRITIPSDRAGALDTALAMLAGIAHEAVFDSVSAHPESGILFEEWRQGRDAYQRAADARHAVIFAGSPYANRSVIGDTSVLRRFDIAAMRRFYSTWYRPDLMAVIVVGEIETSQVEDLVKQHFGGISRPLDPVRRQPVTPPQPRPMEATVVVDPEATASRIGVWYPVPTPRLRTRSDYREIIIGALWRRILQARLDDASLEEGSPLVGTSVDYRQLARVLSADVIGATAMNDRTLESLERALVEVDRLARHGVTQAEVDEFSLAMFGRGRQSLESGDDTDEMAAALMDHFLNGSAVLTNARIFELVRDILPTVRAADINTYARNLTGGGPLIIIATGTADSLARTAPEAIIARARSAVARSKGSRPASFSRRLMNRQPVPGKITSERKLAEANAFEWTLANGMRVIIKPTRFQFNEVLVRLVAPGGASLASDVEYPSAWLSDTFIREIGVGAMSGSRLARLVESTSITLSLTVSDDAVSFDGNAEPRDLESLFQLLHLNMTEPRHDSVAFERYRDKVRSTRRDRASSPDEVFFDTLTSTVANHHPRARRHTIEFLDQASLATALTFWKTRMSNAAGMTFVMTGDFTLDRVRPLVERYLGSIPQGGAEQPRGTGMAFPPGIIRQEIRAGISERARTAIAFSAPVSVTEETTYELGAVRDLLELALNSRIREALGGTYGVEVRYEIDLLPPTRYAMYVLFDAAPDRVDDLAVAALAELERLRVHGPTAAEFAATREARVRDHEGMLEDNDYWADELITHARFGWSLAGISQHGERAEALTQAKLAQMSARYIRTGEYTRLTMRPGGKYAR